MAKNPQLIQVGVILAAHGVRGQVKIRSFTEEPADIFTYCSLTDATGKRRFALKAHGGQPEAMIAAIEGVTDRNQAELLKGVGIYASEDELPEMGDNEFYYGQLEGLTAKLENGGVFGRVTGVFNFGAGDVIEIELPDGKSEMLPFSGAFVGDVKPDEGYLIVFPPNYVEPEGEEEA